jgi:hypothetical protein
MEKTYYDRNGNIIDYYTIFGIRMTRTMKP